MRILHTMVTTILSVLILLCCYNPILIHAAQPIRNLSVTLRGKQYDVTDVITVKDLQLKVQEITGVETNQQGTVMFNNKPLTTDTILSDSGVEDGSKINILSQSSTNGLPSKEEMEEYLQQAGISKEKLDEMMSSLGGSGEGGLPNMEESMKAMTDVMNSPLFQQMMSDPEKLEQSRQMILNNPMLKGMMGNMPGMEDILNDEVAWRQAMQAAAELYKSMDPNELMSAMMGGASNRLASSSSSIDLDMFGSSLPTLDSMETKPSSSAAAALEELDEDD